MADKKEAAAIEEAEKYPEEEAALLHEAREAKRKKEEAKQSDDEKTKSKSVKDKRLPFAREVVEDKFRAEEITRGIEEEQSEEKMAEFKKERTKSKAPEKPTSSKKIEIREEDAGQALQEALTQMRKSADTDIRGWGDEKAERKKQTEKKNEAKERFYAAKKALINYHRKNIEAAWIKKNQKRLFKLSREEKKKLVEKEIDKKLTPLKALIQKNFMRAIRGEKPAKLKKLMKEYK